MLNYAIGKKCKYNNLARIESFYGLFVFELSIRKSFDNKLLLLRCKYPIL